MNAAAAWKPTRFELRGGRLRGARNVLELGAAWRLISDLVAALHREHLHPHARHGMLDLGCDKVSLFGTSAPWVDASC